MNTNQAMYKAVCEQRSKPESHPTVIEKITVEYARELFVNRKYKHNVALTGSIWFIDEYDRPIRVQGVNIKTASIMSYDYFRYNKKEPK